MGAAVAGCSGVVMRHVTVVTRHVTHAVRRGARARGGGAAAAGVWRGGGRRQQVRGHARDDVREVRDVHEARDVREARDVHEARDARFGDATEGT